MITTWNLESGSHIVDIILGCKLDPQYSGRDTLQATISNRGNKNSGNLNNLSAAPATMQQAIPIFTMDGIEALQYVRLCNG